jgi:hypothetical protein
MFLDAPFGVDGRDHTLKREIIILFNLYNFISFEADILSVLAEGDLNNFIIIILRSDHPVLGYSNNDVAGWILEHVFNLLENG